MSLLVVKANPQAWLGLCRDKVFLLLDLNIAERGRIGRVLQD